MSGKLHSPFQVGDEPLGRSIRRMHFWGEIAGLKRYWCGAMQAAKKPGLAQRSHGECKQSGVQPTGKGYPWHIIPCIQWTYHPLNMGQRMHLKVYPESDRGWIRASTSPKDITEHLNYSVIMRDSPRRGLGCHANRHLHDLVEFIIVNVGGPCRNVKVCIPLMSGMEVGGSIVVGAWESHVHGEGSQGIDISRVDISGHMPVNSGATRWTVARYGSGGGGREPTWDDKSSGNAGGGRPIPGEPGAVKVACPVRRGG
jgi:hypothetical protein